MDEKKKKAEAERESAAIGKMILNQTLKAAS